MNPRECPTCHGAGEIHGSVMDDLPAEYVPCPTCAGCGKVVAASDYDSAHARAAREERATLAALAESDEHRHAAAHWQTVARVLAQELVSGDEPMPWDGYYDWERERVRTVERAVEWAEAEAYALAETAEPPTGGGKEE